MTGLPWALCGGCFPPSRPLLFQEGGHQTDKRDHSPEGTTDRRRSQPSSPTCPVAPGAVSTAARHSHHSHVSVPFTRCHDNQCSRLTGLTGSLASSCLQVGDQESGTLTALGVSPPLWEVSKARLSRPYQPREAPAPLPGDSAHASSFRPARATGTRNFLLRNSWPAHQGPHPRGVHQGASTWAHTWAGDRWEITDWQPTSCLGNGGAEEL